MLVPDGVVEGLDLAVMKHNEEEAFEVSVAPEYGFGSREEQRALATVPPNSQLHYAVEVLEVQKVHHMRKASPFGAWVVLVCAFQKGSNRPPDP